MNARAGLGRGRLLVAAVVIVLVSVLSLSLLWGLQHAVLVNPPVLGKTAPHLAIKTGAGNEVRIWELQGKPVVVNFWASWCGPCVQELTVLSKASITHPDVAFVGADTQDRLDSFWVFEEDHPHPYPVGPIISGSSQSYGVAGLPATFFINSRGVVVASFSGPLDQPTLDHYLSLIAT